MSLLELRDVQAWYAEKPTLRGVTLTIEDGDLAAVVGANGAGKTTLLRAIARSVRVSGEILLEGESIGRHSPAAMARRGIAYVPEGGGMLSALSVLDNLRLGAWIQRGPLDNAYARVYELLPFLYDKRHARAGTLSAGDQRLLALGCAAMARPRLVLFDEPSAGVPRETTQQVIAALRELNERGTAIVVAEQRAGLALASTERAVVLDAGRVVFDGSTEALRSGGSAFPALLAP